MEDYNFSQAEVINASQAFRGDFKPREEPKIDPVISEIVGKPIKVTNPTLISIVVKYKKARGDSDEPDNFLQNPDFIAELKEKL